MLGVKVELLLWCLFEDGKALLVVGAEVLLAALTGDRQVVAEGELGDHSEVDLEDPAGAPIGRVVQAAVAAEVKGRLLAGHGCDPVRGVQEARAEVKSMPLSRVLLCGEARSMREGG